MKLLDEGYLLLTKPRVVHSIPGRLRLQVPLLKKVGKEGQEYIQVLSSLLKIPEGIVDVSVSRITGTVLLHYDSSLVSEEEILSFISSLSRVFVSQKDDLSRLLTNDSETVFQCLRQWLQRTMSRRLHLDVNQRILLDDFHQKNTPDEL